MMLHKTAFEFKYNLNIKLNLHKSLPAQKDQYASIY